MSKISKEIRESIEKVLPKEIAAQQFCAFRYNLDRDISGKRCEGIVTCDDEVLRRIEDGSVVESIKCEEISEIITDMGVGCIFMSYRSKLDNEMHLLCRADLKCSDSMVRNTRMLNPFFEDGTLPPMSEEKERCCPKCGRPYRPGSEICPHCSDKKKIVLRTWQLFAPYKIFVFLSVFMFFGISALNLIMPYINRVLVDNYIQNPEVESVKISSYVVILLSMLALEFVLRGLGMARTHLLIKASNKMIVDLRNKLFDKIQRLSIAKISQRAAGDLMQRVTSDTAAVENFLVSHLPSMIEQGVVFVVVGIFLFVYDPILCFMIFVPTPFVVLSFRFFWKFMGRFFRKRWFTGSRTNSILHDIFSGIRVVKAFGMEHKESIRFHDATLAEREVQEKSDCIWSILMPILRFFICFGEFIILFYVGNRILDGRMTLGEMTQFSSYASMIYSPLRMIAMIPRHLMRFTTSATKIFEILDEDEDVSDADKAVDIKIQGNIDVENVSFGYDTGKDVLRKVSLQIRPGEFVGIVGASGVGKSTLINLIMRMYDVEQGRILVDGIDIRDISQESLRSQIGVVLQETYLFSGTIYQNIAYAKPKATREEIIAVSKLAGCHDFITRLPDGYNTKVGEKGSTLSGGERQRVAIARALLHDPKILILDEATASLDTETEKQIQDALARLSAQRTTIAIAHRLSTLRNATRLVVLDRGRVAEMGTHDELMEKRGIYYGLVMAQREMSSMEA